MSGACLTAGIYFSHCECWGHASRAMGVGEVYKKRFPHGNLFFIQAGLDQAQATINRLGPVYALPGPFMSRRHFKGSGRGPGDHIPLRRKACEDILSREKPDLLMTEFFPLGWEDCRHELVPALAKSAAQGAALWAVAGYPLLTGQAQSWREKVLRLYQKIFIFSPPSEKDYLARFLNRPQNYLDFFEKYASKIIFAGYLLPTQPMVRREGKDVQLAAPRGSCRVAVVRGGGAVYPKMIAQAIRASDLLGREYYFTVVAGPSTTDEEWDLFEALRKKKKTENLSLQRVTRDYEGLIERSDVCVSLASYHTAVMLLKYRKKAVLIPFEGHKPMSIAEQPARAAMLKEMTGARVLSIDRLTAQAFAEAVQKAAARPTVTARIPPEWFGGADVLDGQLRGLFGR